MPPWSWIVGPAIVHVCPQPGPGCDATTIEEALALQPDFVELEPGRYPAQNVRIDRANVTIKSKDPSRPAELVLSETALTQAGPLLSVEADGVVLRNLVLDGASPPPVGDPVDARAVVARNVQGLSLEGVVARGFRWAADGGTLLAEDATVYIDRSTFEDGEAAGFGGFVRSTGAGALAVAGSLFRRGTANYGGAIATDGVDVYVFDSTFQDQVARIKAGHLLVQNGVLDVLDSSLDGGTAPQWGLLDVQTSSFVSLKSLSLGGTSSPSAGLALVQNAAFTAISDLTMGQIGASAPGLRVIGGDVRIEDSAFANSAVDTEGAVVLESPASADVQRSWFCNAGSTRGALELVGECSGGCTLRHNVFLANESRVADTPTPEPPSAAALVVDLTGFVSVDRNTFADNVHQSPALVGSVIAVSDADLALTDNLLVGNQSTAPVTLFQDNPSLFVSRNASDASDNLIPQDELPNLLPAVPSTTFDTEVRSQPTVCLSAEPWLPATAPFPGAFGSDDDGDGFLLANDCDDFAADAYPGAPEIPGDGLDQDCDDLESCYVDSDGDGFGTDELVPTTDWGCTLPGNTAIPGDCDDTDAGRNPSAPEIVDDVDSNCDGIDGPDSDGDGVHEPEDCDDGDPTIYPGAPDPFDGIDQDCDGVLEEPEEPPDRDGDGVPFPEDCDDDDPDRILCRGYLAGVGCTVGTPGPLPLALLLLAAFRRRVS